GGHKDALVHNNEIGDLGVKNQSLGTWDAFVEKFQKVGKSGEPLYCPLCLTGCMEASFIEKEGKKIRQQPLEMLMPVGANCLIDDFDALEEGYELCNRYGIDTISFGYTLAFAMEAFEKGLINREDTGGIDLTWGNQEAMLEMIRQVGEGRGFGRVLGEGSKRAAEHIGGDAAQYAMQVKGLEVTHWDPRVFNSLALAYATGNKGGSHYESPSHALERRRPEAKHGIDLAEFGYPQGVSRLGFEDKAGIVKKMQDLVCVINSLVICQKSFQSNGVRIATHVSWLNAITGWDMDIDEFLQAGERIFNLKRLLNLSRGLSGKDDTLPQRLLTRMPDMADDEQGVPDSLEELLQEYYALRGWTGDGSPTREKLAELGLP
ncbi:aldehyde ferredoxin oxidoreductase C-terminal domain-containing protein, partial [Chloroflexota bacterium]